MGFTVPERVEAMNKTTIEYLDYTWNPLAMRCTPVSEGCRDCWHIQRANMLAKNPLIPEHIQKAYAGGLPVLIESRLEEPLKVKKPSIIGVQFMGDLFHDDVKFEWKHLRGSEKPPSVRLIHPTKNTLQLTNARALPNLPKNIKHTGGHIRAPGRNNIAL